LLGEKEQEVLEEIAYKKLQLVKEGGKNIKRPRML